MTTPRLAIALSAVASLAPVFSAHATNASRGEQAALTLAPQNDPKLQPLVSAYRAAIAKPARDLKKAEAAIILAFLHDAGFLQLVHGFSNKDRKAPVVEGSKLKWPSATERIGFGPWVKFADGGEPLPPPGQGKIGPIEGHFGFVEAMIVKRKMSRADIKKHTVPPLQLDPRSAVALYRTANWLYDNYGCTELHHAGVNGALPSQRNDCHGQGRALDFAGVTCTKWDKTFEYFVYYDWGMAKVPPGSKTDWPSKSGVSSYRLASHLADEQPSAARFFFDFFKFLATQWRPGPESLPRDPAEKVKGGFIMHPDHYTSDPKGSGGREKHKNHIHVQIGETGPDKPGAGM